MKKQILLLLLIAVSVTAYAQRRATKVIDNKGTFKWVLDSSSHFVDTAYNGLTKANDSTLKLGGKLVESTTLDINGQKLQIANLLSGVGTDSLIVADPTTGELKRISASRLLQNLQGKNGLTKVNDSIKLGGALTEATTITTTATNTLSITGLQSGAVTDSIVVVDPATSTLKYISKSTLLSGLSANNGLTKVGDSVQLGGTLNKATTITTSGTNTLSLQGLTSGSTATDSLLVAGGTDGVIKRVSVSTLLQSGEQSFTATTGLATYAVTDMPATVSKVWVYRNGAKLVGTTDYTVSAGIVTLTTGMAALVVADDVIEVQWVK